MSWFSDAGHALEHLGQQVGHQVEHVFTGNPRPDPRRFSSPQTPMPTQNGSSYSLPGGPTQPPVPGIGGGFGSGSAYGLTSQQQAQLQSAFSAAGLWDTIKNLGGDTWGVIVGLLPKNADGSIDWGKVGGDVVKWAKDNAGTIVQAASAYSQYQRQKESDKYADEALNGIPGTSYKGAIAEYAAKQPLRDAGQAGMLDPSKNVPDLSALRNLAGAGSGNPFARAMSPTMNATPLPIAPPPLPLNTMSAPLDGTPHPLPVNRVPMSGAIPRGSGNGPAGVRALPIGPTPPTPPKPPGPPGMRNVSALPIARMA